MLQESVLIEKNEEIAPGLYFLKIKTAGMAGQAEPGQFIHINLGTIYDPLLRRPMSILNAQGETLSVLYQVVGRGTRIMTRFRPRDEIDVLGPLGKGFEIEDSGQNFLVGGGVGAAPLVFLAHRLIKKEVDNKFFLGMRERELLFIKDFLPEEVEFFSSHENSPRGEAKQVTDLLPPHLKTEKKTSLYCCGPEGMYREIASLCNDCGDFSIQVSIDRRMGCGVGTCLGCAVKVKKPPREELQIVRACIEGPVFRWQEVNIDGT